MHCCRRGDLCSEPDLRRRQPDLLWSGELHRLYNLCRNRDLPYGILRQCSDLRRDKHLSVAHLSGHCHLWRGDLSGFGDLQGFPVLPRLCNLSRDPNLRRCGNMSESQYMSGNADLPWYDHMCGDDVHLRHAGHMLWIPDLFRRGDLPQHGDLPWHHNLRSGCVRTDCSGPAHLRWREHVRNSHLCRQSHVPIDLVPRQSHVQVVRHL